MENNKDDVLEETQESKDDVLEETKESKLEKYRKSVESLAKSKSDFVFQNQDANHAAIVISNIIKYSNEEIKIFDDDLSGDIADNSEELLNAIEESIINDKKKVKILLKDDSHKETAIYKLLEKLVKTNDNLEVKKANQHFIDNLKELSVDIVNENTAINFAVGDDSAFRIEFPKNERRAFCSFNNVRISSALSKVFDDAFKHSTSIF